jgi:SPP1 gp7 family putative phage head morphogenesis protein
MIFVQRYAKGIEKSQRQRIAAIFDEADVILQKYPLDDMSLIDESKLYAELRELFSDALGEEADKITDELIRFAVSEAEFSADMFGRAVKPIVNIPTLQELESDVYQSSFGFQQGLTIRSALDKFGIQKTRQAIQTIRDGVLEGKTSQQITSAFRGLFSLHARQAGTLVRTGVNHVSTVARMTTIEQNTNLFDGYEWVSTLDSRTSLICMSRDGIVYSFRPESPIPPAHFNCRSTVVPKVKDKFNLLKDVGGDRPSIGYDGAKSVSGRMTYSGWLRKQPASFQDKVLGKSRGKLFRQGKLALTHFVDDSGETYTLDELRSLRPQEFEDANL